MFKKRNVENKKDIAKDLQEIEIQNQDDNSELVLAPKSLATKKINKFSTQPQKQGQADSVQTKKKPVIVKYGLIDKQQVNSKYHANQESEEQKQAEKHSVMNLYIKKKMEELGGAKQESTQRKDAIGTQQILQMQKKYLDMGEQKLAEYDIVEILKKLENMANNSIKHEIQSRNNYLKNLLENEHQKMQYASKKQLKTIRQTKQRIEQQFKNKYNESGRRGYVQKIKYQSMFNK